MRRRRAATRSLASRGTRARAPAIEPIGALGRRVYNARRMRAPIAIVVLGCWIDPTGAPGPAASRRAAAGLRALRAGLAPRLIASGGRRWPTRSGGRVAESTAIARWLVDAGAHEQTVLRELASMNTSENAIYARSLLERIEGRVERGARVFIATCAWHLPRALDAFRRAGFDPTGLPAGARSTPTQRALQIAHELLSSRLDRGRASIPTFHGADHLGGERK